MLFEIGAGQSGDLKKIAKENGFEASVGYDLSGHDRRVCLMQNAECRMQN
jgi:hypothetical protein